MPRWDETDDAGLRRPFSAPLSAPPLLEAGEP